MVPAWAPNKQSEVQIDQLYKLLDENIKEVLLLLTQFEIGMHDSATIKLDTSMVSIFLNRCHLSFKQMMFENLSQLKVSLSKFIAGSAEYEYQHAPLFYEKWIQDQAVSIETSMTTISNAEQMNKIESLTRDAVRNKSYHMRHLLTSLVHTFSKND